MSEPIQLDRHPAVAVQETEADEGYGLMRNRELHGFSAMKVTATETKPWGAVAATKIEVTKGDGSSVEVGADDLLYKFVRGGKELTVTVAAAEHIDNLHIKGTDAGSRFDEPTLDALMVDMAAKIPPTVATEPGVSAFSVDMGKHMGNEGIASLAELKAEGVLADSDIATAEAVKDQVIKLNRSGDAAAKSAFIEAFKTDHPDCKIQFQVIRGSVLVPTVETPKRPTTKLFMVFGPTDTGKTLWTAAPGRDMPKHPDPKQHQAGEVFDEESFQRSAEAWFETAMLTGE